MCKTTNKMKCGRSLKFCWEREEKINDKKEKEKKKEREKVLYVQKIHEEREKHWFLFRGGNYYPICG